jgi:tRNA A-37 threonylcarbamoyl transferase component Bud32/tetratricopeptide (TPR) repeat protein/TolB-like protein
MDIRDQLTAALGAGYTIERELGGGGMSRVFVADETRLKRKVVVKVLAPDLAQGVSAERFEREIELAASLQQANIVPVLSAGESGGLPFYTMPFVEGESLRARLGHAGAVPIPEVVSILRDVARALAYAHERGVVHRDIKPDNVLLSGGAAVVTDFGIAKALSAARAAAGAAGLTQVGTSIGTPTYMAPEQALGDPNADHRADIYAFGCMAYELLVGRPPFDEPNVQRLFVAHLTTPPASVVGRRPDAPPGLAALVERCLAKDPAARPQSAGEILALLDSAGSEASIVTAGTPRTLAVALSIYAAAFIVIAILARQSITSIGLPDWVFPGALIVMALGLPVVLLTALRASPVLSWRRTVVGGAIALGTFVAGTGGFMAMRAAGIGPAGSLVARGAVKAREPVLITDFTARGDTNLGNVVTEAVRADLGQSSAISVVAPAAVTAALQRMQRAPSSRFDLVLAREVAAREGIKGIVDGEITPLGAGYVVSIRLVAADSGTELTSFRTVVDKPSELIDGINGLSRRLRGKIGESLKSVQGSPPLAQVTTTSLDALRKFTEATRANRESDYNRAVLLLRQAVAIDSSFAMAWFTLSIAAANGQGFPQSLQDSSLVMAYRFRDRLLSGTKLAIEARYFDNGPGRDKLRALQLYERMFAADSGTSLANTLALTLDGLGKFARAESLFAWTIRRAPDFTLPFGNIVPSQFNQGETAAAESSIVRARTRHPEYLTGVIHAAVMRYQKGNFTDYRRALDSMRTASAARLRITGTYSISDLDLINGRIHDAERSFANARNLDAESGRTVPAIVDSIGAALHDAWFFEQPQRAARRLDAALATQPLKPLPVVDRPYVALASAYAFAGRPDRARQIVHDFEAEADTSLKRYLAPDIEGALADIAIAEGKPRDAIVHLGRWQQGYSRERDRLTKEPATYFARLGFAYDLAHDPDSAITAFRTYLNTPSWHRYQGPNDPLYLAAVYKRLGELYVAKGDARDAATYFTKFIDLWKNADPELQPKVAEVRQRLARLGDVERR